jgi:dolichol-phosphate mannosyltransferase
MTNRDNPTDPIDLTIMLPAYNEAAALRDLLPTIKVAAAAITPNYEILILDTQTAMDDTEEVCALNGVRHVRRSGGNQFGDVIRTGIAEARGQHLLCMDADGSHSATSFASMWAQHEAFDIVIGSRYVAGGHTENPAILI